MAVAPATGCRRRKGIRTLLTVAAITLLAGAGVGTVPSPATAQEACRNPIEASPVIAEVPWAQRWFGPDRVWPLSRGSGVTVAVIDSGVDIEHPQLAAARVRPGRDLVEDGGTDGRVDCGAHGTAVASLIAAAPVEGVGFAGLAPRVEILPIRVADRNVDINDPEQEPPVTPTALARAITWAADQGAGVVNISITFYHDHRVIADAVQYAQDRDVVLVAAAGNVHIEDAPDPVPYPAAYAGVVGVGAIDADGLRLPGSYAGPHVELVAPGSGVTVAAPGAGHLVTSGTSFAAPFVSASAALVRAADPELPAEAVIRRLTATADPAGSATEQGHGVINPYRALTERLTTGEPAAAEPLPEVVVDPAAVARERQWQLTVERARWVAGVVIGLCVLALVGAAVWRRGRPRRWRPGVPAEPTPSGPETDEPERLFFTVPAPQR